jgi:hypothetical protein
MDLRVLIYGVVVVEPRFEDMFQPLVDAHWQGGSLKNNFSLLYPFDVYRMPKFQCLLK